MLVLIALVVTWLIVGNLLPLLRPGPAAASGDFVVRVAPFRSSGEDERHGRIVAEQLLQELNLRITTPMNLGLLPAPIRSASDAMTQAQTIGADVIIWGDVAAGATATQASLTPYLVWNPGAPFAPATWQGFDGHFALPHDYELALQPLNGPAVLAPLLDSINHFSRGDADRAAATLATLQRDYNNVLRAELPSMIRALVFWAEGMLSEATTEARNVLAVADRPQHRNNVGALLLDQAQLDLARAELQATLRVAPDLPQAHANLGRLFMDEGDPAGGLPHLRRAIQLLPNSPPIIATLGEAYRRSGQLEEARAATETVLRLDPGNGPALAERGMLALTPITTTNRLLEWELEQPPARTRDELLEIRRQVEGGIAAIETLRNEFLRRAAAYGVDGRPTMQRLAETQAAILQRELLNRRYQLMLIQIEQGRVLADVQRSRLRRLWDGLRGQRTPFEEAIANANDILSREPSLSLQYEVHYQKGRAAFLSRHLQLARTHWDAARQLVADAAAGSPLHARPEAWYGDALLLHHDGNRDGARESLTTALRIDDRYFPAHELLARMAEEDGRWSEAETHARWLVTHRPWESRHTIHLARMLYEQGRAGEAETQLLPLANAGDVNALVQLAAIYRKEGLLDAAADALRRARARDPNALPVFEEAAELALAHNDPHTAEHELRRAVQLAPDRVSARIALGRLYAYRLNQPAAAAEQFRAAIERNKDDPLVHRQLGEALLQSGDAKAAVESFQRAIDIAPAAHEAHHGLATAYLALERINEARRAEERALELAGGNYTLAIVGLGDVARAQGRYDEAIAHYTDALSRDPQLPAAYLGLSRVAMARGQPQIAATHIRNGLTHAPNDVPLLLALGDALLQQGDNAGAREQYERVLQLAAGNAAAYAGLGRALWRSGDPDAALAELDRAVQINPGDAATLLLIGEINTTLDRPQAGLDAYGRAVAAREDWYEPHFRRGVLLLKLERTNEAIADLEAAVRLNREFGQAAYWLGRAYRAAGRFEDARRQFARAVELDGNYFEARYFLGRALSELGRNPDAIAAYESLIADAPPNDPWRAEAARELERLR